MERCPCLAIALPQTIRQPQQMEMHRNGWWTLLADPLQPEEESLREAPPAGSWPY